MLSQSLKISGVKFFLEVVQLHKKTQNCKWGRKYLAFEKRKKTLIYNSHSYNVILDRFRPFATENTYFSA